jgi:hypothetical protein
MFYGLRGTRPLFSLTRSATKSPVCNFLVRRAPAFRLRKSLLGMTQRQHPARSFIAEEFIGVERLSVAWPRLSEEQKTNIIREVAEVIATLGETRFNLIMEQSIGGSAGPTVEAAKVLNGRVKFHSEATTT